MALTVDTRVGGANLGFDPNLQPRPGRGGADRERHDLILVAANHFSGARGVIGQRFGITGGHADEGAQRPADDLLVE